MRWGQQSGGGPRRRILIPPEASTRSGMPPRSAGIPLLLRAAVLARGHTLEPRAEAEPRTESRDREPRVESREREREPRSKSGGPRAARR